MIVVTLARDSNLVIAHSFMSFLSQVSNLFHLFLFFLEPEGCVWVDMLEKNSMKTLAARCVLVIYYYAITKFEDLRKGCVNR
jgi:hypothetical protein